MGYRVAFRAYVAMNSSSARIPGGPSHGQSSSEVHNLASSSSSQGPEGQREEAYRLVRSLWRSHYRHTVVARPLQPGIVQFAEKKELWTRLLADGAKCFWRAALLAVKPSRLGSFRMAYFSDGVDPCEGVTPQAAIACCRHLGIACYLHYPSEGNVETLVEHPEKMGIGLLNVLANDMDHVSQHWLPVNMVRDAVAPYDAGLIRRINRELNLTLSVPEAPAPAPVSVEPERPRTPPRPVITVPSDTVASFNLFGILLDEVPEHVEEGEEVPIEVGTRARARGRDRSTPQSPNATRRRVPRDVLDRLPRVERALVRVNPLDRHPVDPILRALNELPDVRHREEDPEPAGMAEFRREVRNPEVLYGCQDLLPPAGFGDVDWTPPWCAVAVGEEAPPVEIVGPIGMCTSWRGWKSQECPPLVHRLEKRWLSFPPFLEGLFPKMIEARKAVLMNESVRDGDVLYVRERPQSFLNPEFELMGGAMNLMRFAGLSMPHGRLLAHAPRRIFVGGVGYLYTTLYEDNQTAKTPMGCIKRFIRGFLRNLAYQQIVVPAAQWCADKGLEWLPKIFRQVQVAFDSLWAEPRRKPLCINVDSQTIEVPSLARLPAELPVDAKVREIYNGLVRVVPEHLAGPLRDIRSSHLGMRNPESVEPVDVVSHVIRVDRDVRAQLMSIPAFSVPKSRHPRNCVCCGKMPPEGKYRWRRRTCEVCVQSLRARGYVTFAGYQVQEGMSPSTCYPGIVYLQGDQKPPPEAKWADVASPYLGKEEGRTSSVQVARRSLGIRQGFGERGQGWVDCDKTILDSLREPNPPRWRAALAGIACSGATPMVSANTDYNRCKALFGRVYRQPALAEWGSGPMPGVWEWAKQFVPEILPDFTAPRMKVEDWLQSMPARRRKPLAMAYEEYKRRGLTKSAKTFKAFVKEEMLPGFSQKGGRLERLSAMMDRLIQGPADVTHVIAGPILKPLVHRLKGIWGPEEAIVYGSACPETLHRLLQRLVDGRGLYFWSDFSMFDCTHSRDSWAFMESLYPKDDPDFRKVLAMWRAPEGYIGNFRYQADVMNASGRDDTALANAILNGFATFLSVTAILRGKDLMTITLEDVRWAKSQMVLSVCGDDSIGKLPLWATGIEGFEAMFKQNIRKFGFEAKFESSLMVEEAVYLGMRPTPTRKGWFWGKTIGRASYKMGWCLKPDSRDVMAHITGIADMHCLCSSHVPILSDLARKIVELRTGAKRSPVVLDDNKPWEWTFKSGVEYDDLTLESLSRVYTKGTTVIRVEDLKNLIAEIAAVTTLPAVLDSHVWQTIVASDDL